MAQSDHSREDLSKIKERLRAGRLTKEDISTLESIVLKAERAIGGLRAAMVE